MRNTIITIVAVLILGVGGWYVLSGDFTPTENQTATVISAEQTVVTVNGEKILGADFNALQTQIAIERGLDLATLNEQEKSQLQTQTMDMLISRTLLQQAVANSTDINITENEVAVQMETIRNRFENEAAFNEELSAQRITEEALQTRVGYELAVQKYLEQELNISSVDVTEAEVDALYEELKARQNGQSLEETRDQVKSLAIQQKQQGLANKLIEELRAKADIEILI